MNHQSRQRQLPEKLSEHSTILEIISNQLKNGKAYMKILYQKTLGYTMGYYLFCKTSYNDYRWNHYEKYRK